MLIRPRMIMILSPRPSFIPVVAASGGKRLICCERFAVKGEWREGTNLGVNRSDYRSIVFFAFVEVIFSNSVVHLFIQVHASLYAGHYKACNDKAKTKIELPHDITD